ncbi:MAG TPA: S-adenosylmethionine:tRNA ribosyltransferase-isomerase, partial [Chitinophagaceae bacterium]|nr:S-adenosylmethionine:tRNA ribosyltransferase-isomerase [Chitinophagaceae bacterium]
MVAINMHPGKLSIRDYTYDLPEDRIAKYPLTERDASRLLIYKNGHITEDIYRNIAAHIPEESLLLLNNTRVVEARLLFHKPTGGVIEIFCLEPHEQYRDISTAMLQQGKVIWLCLVGGASKWKRGQVLEMKIKSGEGDIILEAKYIEKRPDHFLIELSWQPPQLSFSELLHYAGNIPLPPYIRRAVESSDKERYQTVYALEEGSVAAPTAGLHFTETIFNALRVKNIQTDFITLHVGAGTFKPVKTETMEQHIMHAEYFEVSRKTIKNILRHLDKNIIAVGTTSLRTIESIYWMGVKQATNPSSLPRQFILSQWEPYEWSGPELTAGESLSNLLQLMEENNLENLQARTQIIIAPGYRPRLVNALVTNFHQPQSTLLLLVAAL